MDTTDAIVAVETEYRALLNDPRRSLSRFVEVSLDYGRMLIDPDPHHAVEVFAMALDTLHDPPAPAEAEIAIDLIRALRHVAAQLGLAAPELDAIRRERRLLDHELASADPGDRERLCRRAAAVRFADGHIGDGFVELMDGLRGATTDGLDDLATDLVLAVRRHHVPAELMADLEAMWIELRRQRFDGNWPLWCLTALGALRLDVGDVVTAQMYVRRAESILGHLERPVAGALVGGWVALAADDFVRAHERFTFATNSFTSDERMRLLAAAGLGESLICLGRPDEARAPLAEAIAYDVGDPQTVARCHELLAEIAANDGRHTDAYEHLQVTRRLEQVATGGPVPVARLQAGLAPVDPHAAGAQSDGPEPDEPGPDMAGSDDAGPKVTADHGAGADLRPDVVDLREEPLSLEPQSVVVDALRNEWFRLEFQPIIDNTRQRPGAAEALLRLDHPERGTLHPVDFLGELTDARALAEELCMWTVSQACEVLARWNAGGGTFAVVVNVSEHQLTAALPLIVRSALARSGARPDLLTLEVDGSSVGRIGPEQIQVLNEVRAIGARIGIDRFGGEFRSIDTLLRLPVDVVKFDRCVFGRGPLQPLERRMVDTVVALARAFGFEVIATGIETQQQFELQQEFGCHGAQGYLLGAPVPEAQFIERLLHVA